MRALTKVEHDFYVDIVGRRLRTMLHHINQARCKAGGASWVYELLHIPEDTPKRARLSTKASSCVYDVDFQQC